MANEFKLSYTAKEINDKLGEIDNLANTVKITAQALTDEQKAQVRENIGATSKATTATLQSLMVELLSAAVYTSDQSDNIRLLKNVFSNQSTDIHVGDILIGLGVDFSNGLRYYGINNTARALVMPSAQYLTKGKTYKFSLGSAKDDYYYGVQVFEVTQAGLDLQPVIGEEISYGTELVSSRKLDSGWNKNDYQYNCVSENHVLCVAFKNNASSALTENDRVTLLANFTIEEV